MNFNEFYFLERNISVEKGCEYETFIADLFRQKGVDVPNTGCTGPGADIVCKFTKGNIFIEAKNLEDNTDIDRLDFGQGRIAFDVSKNQWIIGGTSKNLDSDKNLVMLIIFEDYIKKFLDPKIELFRNFIEENKKDINVKIKNNLISSVNLRNVKNEKGDSIVGGTIKNKLQEILFEGNRETVIKVDKHIISEYYSKYDFIQIKRIGLFSLNKKNNKESKELKIPSLDNEITSASVRLRLKYHTGSRTDFSNFSITFAIKLKLNNSNFNLENNNQLESFITIFQNE